MPHAFWGPVAPPPYICMYKIMNTPPPPPSVPPQNMTVKSQHWWTFLTLAQPSLISYDIDQLSSSLDYTC